MKTGILSALLALALTTFTTPGITSDTDSHRHAVERLFELTRMQEKIEASVNNVVTMQLNQDPALREHEALFRDYMERHIGWSGLKEPLIDMYMQTFTLEELNEMNAFYGSPTGKKMVAKLPELIKRRDQFAMQRMQDNIGELQKEIEAARSAPQ